MTDVIDETCLISEKSSDEVFSAYSEYHSFTDISPAANPHKLIFNTDKQILMDYWILDPKISIGFGANNWTKTVIKENSWVFDSSTPNNQVSIPSNYELIGEMSGNYNIGSMIAELTEDIDASSNSNYAIHLTGTFGSYSTSLQYFDYLKIVELTPLPPAEGASSSQDQFGQAVMYFSGVKPGFNYTVNIYKIIE